MGNLETPIYYKNLLEDYYLSVFENDGRIVIDKVSTYKMGAVDSDSGYYLVERVKLRLNDTDTKQGVNKVMYQYETNNMEEEVLFQGEFLDKTAMEECLEIAGRLTGLHTDLEKLLEDYLEDSK